MAAGAMVAWVVGQEVGRGDDQRGTSMAAREGPRLHPTVGSLRRNDLGNGRARSGGVG
jgi:hypothetical protein